VLAGLLVGDVRAYEVRFGSLNAWARSLASRFDCTRSTPHFARKAAMASGPGVLLVEVIWNAYTATSTKPVRFVS
jgi:hypothetical protein